MCRLWMTVLIVLAAIWLAYHAASNAHGADAGEPAAQSPATSPTEEPPSVQSLLGQVLPKAKDLVEPLEGGEVNWTTGQLIAVGEGKAKGVGAQQADLAKRAAQLAAARNALLMLGGVRVGPGGQFKDVASGTIKVQGVLENYREVSSEFDPQTRTATVKLAVPLYGARGAVKLFGVELAGRVKPVAPPPGRKKADVRLIILDARGTGFRPCALPRIAKASGDVVFDIAQTPAMKSPDPKQPVVYVKMLPDEKLDKAMPLEDPEKKGQVVVLTAQKSPARSPGTIALADDDANDLMSYLATGGLLDSGRVVVVTDPPAKDDSASRPTK